MGRLVLAADRPGGDRRLPRRRPRPADHHRDGLQRRPDAAVPRRRPRRQAPQRQQGLGLQVEHDDGRGGLQRAPLRRHEGQGAGLHPRREERGRAREERRDGERPQRQARDGGAGEGRGEEGELPREGLQGQARRRPRDAAGAGRGCEVHGGGRRREREPRRLRGRREEGDGGRRFEGPRQGSSMGAGPEGRPQRSRRGQGPALPGGRHLLRRSRTARPQRHGTLLRYINSFVHMK